MLWLHVVAAAVWMGGVVYQAHVLLPAARRGAGDAFGDAARRARPATWTAIALVVLTGLYNVTQLGDLERVMESGAGLMVAGKFGLVILAVTLASQRDFTLVPRLSREPSAATLKAIAWLDRLVLLLGLATIYLGLAISRGVRL
jgi:putative copper export protein